ncbi:acyl-CoA N-acyltransferase [Acephala macrosclerotiorum]|nr:acyl-CoA N-acyltransferase [Acephala macrosclerotiorum]
MASSIYAAESERLWLQCLSEEHLEGYHAIQNNKLAMMWSQNPPEASLEETLQHLRERQPTPENPWNQRWAILLKGSEKEVGNDGKAEMIGIIGIVREQEIGYKLHPDYWGKGYMTEALRTMLDMFWAAEANKKYNELWAKADPENKASVNVLTKAGFKKSILEKNCYARAYLGGKVMSDLQGFNLFRPGTEDK